MKNEIEIGECVRTKEGIIDKVDRVVGMIENTVHLENSIWIDINDIVKHSKNIIDLIEVGDYVNGMEVYKGKVASGKEKLLVRNHTINGMSLEVVKIRTILTHEIYKNNCYEVER